jgi:hypothetical protein
MTIRRHIIKIKKTAAALKKRTGWKWRLGIAITGAILISAATFWLALPLPQNYETEVPPRPKSYSAKIIALRHDNTKGTILEIKFNADEPALTNLPEYQIEEIFAEAKTRAVFEKISRLENSVDYREIAASPLVEDIKCDIDNGRLIVEVMRQGPYSKARAGGGGNLVTIVFPAAENDYPAISNQKPAANSAVFPMRHTISLEAVLHASLETASIFINNDPVQFRTEQLAPGEYRFAFETDVQLDKEYRIKAIVADQAGRAAVSQWTLEGQIPSAAALGKDRFKYLGWWGQINANGITVRQGASAASEKLGAFSTANRVKVVKEVFGEWVDGKNLWYQIDGGAFAGAYIFSDFVTPMPQPEPPQDIRIPEEIKIGEKWIDVDLSKKIMTLFEYDKPLFATYIAPGREENPTKTGIYRIWYKLAKDEMRGGPPLHSYYYHLKDIPWVMYYNYDYAIHGTYWHDKFGTRQSAGCTNMTQGDAKFIFENTLPELPEGQEEVFAREKPNVGYGTGTVVHNHD